MPDRAPYTDHLRDAFLALATVPLAGFDTATYYVKETLGRTSKFGSQVLAATAIASRARPRDGRRASGRDASASVLTQDLFEAARLYVRSMVRLPADTGIYFTGEMEQRLAQMQPDERDLADYASAELENLLRELDRLAVTVRAAKRTDLPRGRARQALVRKIEGLRVTVRGAVPKVQAGRSNRIRARRVAATLRGPSHPLTIARARTTVRAKVLDAIADAQAFAPGKRRALERLGRQIDRRLAAPATRSAKTHASRKGA